MKSNLLFAAGRTGYHRQNFGKPVFKEGSQEFEADELTYNFKTKKALVRNIITKQEDGLSIVSLQSCWKTAPPIFQKAHIQPVTLIHLTFILTCPELKFIRERKLFPALETWLSKVSLCHW